MGRQRRDGRAADVAAALHQTRRKLVSSLHAAATSRSLSSTCRDSWASACPKGPCYGLPLIHPPNGNPTAPAHMPLGAGCPQDRKIHFSSLLLYLSAHLHNHRHPTHQPLSAACPLAAPWLPGRPTGRWWLLPRAAACYEAPGSERQGPPASRGCSPLSGPAAGRVAAVAVWWVRRADGGEGSSKKGSSGTQAG